jgi:alpha-glucosidase
MLAFASIFHVPMVGSDVCGFGKDTTESLCARWATLGAFYPFYRNHNELGNTPQEFYVWPTVAEAARKAIAIRYRLLDYIYTDFYRQSTTGEPFLQPLFYLYPQDNNTFPIDRQFFFGDAVLVSPVMDEGSTSVDAYFPDDIFYDWYTLAPIRGNGANMTLSNINITDIPLHIRGGTIIPTRASGANTTTELRKQNFNVIIAPGLDGTAVGSLYIDDGNSLEQDSTLEADFKFDNGQLDMRCGPYFDAEVVIETITVLGQETAPSEVKDGNNNSLDFQHDSSRKVVVVQVSIPFNGPTTLSFA